MPDTTQKLSGKRMSVGCQQAVFWKPQWSLKVAAVLRWVTNSMLSLNRSPLRSFLSPLNRLPPPDAPGDDSAKATTPPP